MSSEQPPEPPHPTYPTYPGAQPPPPPERLGGWPEPAGTPPRPTAPPTARWPEPPRAPAPPFRPFASWGSRFGAYLLDSVLIGVLVVLPLYVLMPDSWTVVDAETDLAIADLVVNGALLVVWALYFGLLQGLTGATLGKRALGIAVHRTGTDQPTGFGMGVVRQLAHILDSLPCYLGFLWPIWDRENRTFADMLCNQRVYRVR